MKRLAAFEVQRENFPPINIHFSDGISDVSSSETGAYRLTFDEDAAHKQYQIVVTCDGGQRDYTISHRDLNGVNFEFKNGLDPDSQIVVTVTE